MNSPTDTYFQDLQNLANAQDKAKLATLAAEYADVLSRLPSLRAELKKLLDSTEMLDYLRLVERYAPALQQASDWLFDVDRLQSEVAQDAQMQSALQLTLQTLTLANLAKSLEDFYSLQRRIVENKQRLERERAEAKRQAEEAAKRKAAAEAEAKRQAEEAAIRKAAAEAEAKRQAEETAKRKAEEEAEAKREIKKAANRRMPVEPEMAEISAGRFVMEISDGELDPIRREGPQYEVVFVQGFRLARHAVTFAEYDHYCEAESVDKPDDNGWGRADRPVINVSWEDAQDYIRWLNAQTGKIYRLPTQEEWRYACRARSTLKLPRFIVKWLVFALLPTLQARAMWLPRWIVKRVVGVSSTEFWWGATIHTDQANYNGKDRSYGKRGKLGEYRGKTLPVKTFAPNAWGLYQMLGNVREWCLEPLPAHADGSNRFSYIARGGSWLSKLEELGAEFAASCDYCSRKTGFRLAQGVYSLQQIAIEPDMVAIPAGRFMMGAPATERDSFSSDRPQHEVTFAQGFRLARFPVTFAEYDRYCEVKNIDKPYDLGWGRGNRPVIDVSWNDARGYLRWLNAHTGKAYRLPTEAEWEYACRAGTTTPFWCGETIHTDQANYDGQHVYGDKGKLGDYRQKTLPVKSFAPNPWGLYQMHGNVWEWCQDQWHSHYNGAPTDGSAWLTGGDDSRVVRGGGWGDEPADLRSAFRVGFGPGGRNCNLGFRLAQD